MKEPCQWVNLSEFCIIPIFLTLSKNVEQQKRSIRRLLFYRLHGMFKRFGYLFSKFHWSDFYQVRSKPKIYTQGKSRLRNSNRFFWNAIFFKHRMWIFVTFLYICTITMFQWMVFFFTLNLEKLGLITFEIRKSNSLYTA